MPITFMDNTGDGITTPLINVNVNMPDGNGGTLLISGYVQLVGGAVVTITGSPISWPAAPASVPPLYCNINVDAGNNGVATAQTSTVADPAPLNATSLIVYRATAAPTNTDSALNPNQSEPDNG
jgi:hypothetical protein